MHMGVQNDCYMLILLKRKKEKKDRDAINHLVFVVVVVVVVLDVRPLWEQFQMAISGRDVNVVSNTLNESVVLSGHDVNLRSDDTFGLIILLAKFVCFL